MYKYIIFSLTKKRKKKKKSTIHEKIVMGDQIPRCQRAVARGDANNKI